MARRPCAKLARSLATSLPSSVLVAPKARFISVKMTRTKEPLHGETLKLPKYWYPSRRITAKDPAASAEFMQLVGGSGPYYPLGASAFLSSRPDQESHEIALFANRAYAHIAFKVFSLAELRSFHARVLEKQIPIRFASATVCPLRFISRTRMDT